MNAQRPAYWRYGGQAVIEGVMMRSPRYFAVACRKPDGDMIVHAEPIEKTILGKLQFLNRPLLRVIFLLGRITRRLFCKILTPSCRSPCTQGEPNRRALHGSPREAGGTLRRGATPPMIKARPIYIARQALRLAPRMV